MSTMAFINIIAGFREAILIIAYVDLGSYWFSGSLRYHLIDGHVVQFVFLLIYKHGIIGGL